MPTPYQVPPIADGQELLAVVIESLKLNITFAFDGIKGELNDGISRLDALSLIHSDLCHTLAIVKASKDTI